MPFGRFQVEEAGESNSQGRTYPRVESYRDSPLPSEWQTRTMTDVVYTRTPAPGEMERDRSFTPYQNGGDITPTKIGENEVAEAPSNVPSASRSESIETIVTLKKTDPSPMITVPLSKVPALKLEEIDLQIPENNEKHQTLYYEIAHNRTESSGEKLGSMLLRRGWAFNIRMSFDRIYDPNIDLIQLYMEYGNDPKISKGSQVIISLDEQLKPEKWSAARRKNPSGAQNETDKDIFIEVMIPTATFIGRWQFSIHLSRRYDTWKCKSAPTDAERDIQIHKHSEPIYILFNPWSLNDVVYVKDEVERDEYLIQDFGKIFMGNFRQITSKPWYYGQFEAFVLDMTLDLLDSSNLSIYVRNNPVFVTRALAAVIGGSPTDSLLAASWSGKYASKVVDKPKLSKISKADEPGQPVAPPSWVSSLTILKQYKLTKKPVKYAQCWVYSAVLTTVCRALGLPTRSITAYNVAHDSDGTTSIDYYWHHDGKPLNDKNYDSVWDFHVWNEIWMRRPSLGPFYDGWQAIDPTLQQTSEGLCQAGPYPVTAIREGELILPYHGFLFFASIYSDITHWVIQEDNTWKWALRKHRIGCRISTRMPHKCEKKDLILLRYGAEGAVMDDPERLDITELYKPRGNDEERRTLYKAKLPACVTGNEGVNEDVTFSLEQKDFIMVGSDFSVTVLAINHSRSTRTISGSISLYSAYYTGVRKSLVKSHVFSMVLGPIRRSEAVMRLVADNYQHLVTDQNSFQVQVTARVKETKQYYTDVDIFCLRTPTIYIEMANEVRHGVEVPLRLSFTNPMPNQLNECEWHLEGPGLTRNIRIKHSNVDPFSVVELKTTIIPLRPGARMILSSFQSRELLGVTGSKAIWVS